MLQYDYGFNKIRIVILYKLMFWRYMADRKLIDVKPTRKEILYGFFCTGISLVLLIIFGITIVIFANKYMQNMKGNQNYLETFLIQTEDTTISSFLTTIGGKKQQNNKNINNEDNDKNYKNDDNFKMTIPIKIKTKLITPGTVRKAINAITTTISTTSATISVKSSIISPTTTRLSSNHHKKDKKFQKNDIKDRINWIPESNPSSSLQLSDHSKIKIEELNNVEAAKLYEMINDSIEKNVS